MENFMTYLQWRGDLTFRKSAFNIVDSLIFSRFSYLPFDDILLQKPQKISVISKQFFAMDRQSHPSIVMAQDVELLQQLSQAPRFKNLTVQHYRNTIDLDTEQQFSAVLIHLDAQTSYVAFRGTDLTLVGWKEDLNMSYQKTIPAQHSAVRYLDELEPFLRARVIIGGHSKGGNLAIFAACFAKDSIQQKIIAIHNFDGPGFQEAILKQQQYQMMKPLMITYMPQNAVVGTIFHHDHTIHIANSQAKGIMQHDTFTWQVNHHDIVTLDNANTENVTQQTLDNLLTQLTPDERKKIVDTLYTVLTASGATTVTELQKVDFKTIRQAIKSLQHLSKEEGRLLQDSLGIIWKTWIKR